jgi:hypothetical protein
MELQLVALYSGASLLFPWSTIRQILEVKRKNELHRLFFWFLLTVQSTGELSLTTADYLLTTLVFNNATSS